MDLIDQIGSVHVDADADTIWTECRQCGAIITEYWQEQADLRGLVQDAIDHVCGQDEGDVDHGNSDRD